MLYDRPRLDRGKARVTGPFTVEAVPAPSVKPLDEIEESEAHPADTSVARTGQTLRQGDWRDELFNDVPPIKRSTSRVSFPVKRPGRTQHEAETIHRRRDHRDFERV